MGAVFGVVATVIALLGLLAALAHVGCLAMLTRAAKQAGASGAATIDYVGGRWKVAAGTTLAALVGLLLTGGGVTPDVLGLLLGGGAGIAATKSLGSTWTRMEHPR